MRTQTLRTPGYVRFGLAALIAIAVAGCRRTGPSTEPSPIDREPFSGEAIATIHTLSPLPEVPEDATNDVSSRDAAAHFGRFLFFDERLSENGEVACADCHRPNHGFSVPTRLGHGIGASRRHPPTLVNVAYQTWYDWDGKADSLWAQAARPLENPNEQGASRTDVARTVASNPKLRRAYETVFGEISKLTDDERFPSGARPARNQPGSEARRKWKSMNEKDRERVNRIFSNVAKAIAAYEERLVAGGAPFDRYVRGLKTGDADQLDALSPSAKRGLKLFVGEARCINCHNGPNFSDGTFHNIGLAPRPWLEREDLGRYQGIEKLRASAFRATGPFSDRRDGQAAAQLKYLRRTSESRGQFKTPTLRNLERTAPYMHGGHFRTLEEVVRFYSTLSEQPVVGHREEMLEPLGLSDREVDDLVAFLQSLTGERPPTELFRAPDTPVPPSAQN